MTRNSILLLSCIIMTTLVPVTASGQSHTEIEVAKGVVYSQTVNEGSQPMVVSLLKVDLHQAGVRAVCGQAYGGITSRGPASGRQSVEDIASHYHAIAGVNADFFPWTGRPLDLAIHDGEVYSFPFGGRPAIGFKRNGEAVMAQLQETCVLRMPNHTSIRISAIDQPASAQSAVLYTTFYHLPIKATGDGEAFTVGCGALQPFMLKKVRLLSARPFTSGQLIPAATADTMVLVVSGRQAVPLTTVAAEGYATLSAKLLPNSGVSQSPVWRRVVEAVSGGPWIVRNGEVVSSAQQSGFGLHSFILYHHPRTAVGITASGNLILAVVDGRSPISSGMSLAQLGTLMKEAGAVNAMNLDGGGSSAMVVRGRIVNMPSDGTSRLVANSLLITALANSISTNEPMISLPGTATAITAGTTVHIDCSGHPFLWGTAHGLGFVDQTGRFTSFVAGETTIVAGHGAHRSQLKLVVAPAAVNHLRATLVAETAYTSKLTMHAYDRYGNEVPGISVQVTTTPGSAPLTLTTDRDGSSVTTITWPASTVGTAEVTLTARGVPPLVMQRAAEKVNQTTETPQPIDPDNRSKP